MKSFILAEAKSGYVWNIAVYTGKETQYPCGIPGLPNDLTKSTKIVLNLCEPLIDKGYCIGMNNFYASPELLKILTSRATDAGGTVRFNRKGLSPLVCSKKLKKGENYEQFF